MRGKLFELRKLMINHAINRYKKSELMLMGRATASV